MREQPDNVLEDMIRAALYKQGAVQIDNKGDGCWKLQYKSE